MKYSAVLVAALAAIADATIPIPKGGVPGQPIQESGKGAVFSGGTNNQLDLQNPSNIGGQPATDNGLVPNMKWSFSLSKTRMLYGGWIREQVIQDLPTSHDIAGAQVHLIKGGIRQMHWHRVAEWAYIYAGSFLISAVTEDGQFQLDKLGVGDMYYFPKGAAHSLQGLEDENEILLIFDDGDFDRVGTTFMVADWISHTPKDVLAKNFGVPPSTFDKTYNPDLALINSTISTKTVEGGNGALTGNSSYTFHISNAPEIQVPGGGGTIQVVDSKNFPVSKTIACAVVRLKPGGMRELHWHPTAEEWLYFHSGNARATVYIGGGLARTFDFTAGDAGVFPDNSGHYIENTSETEELIYLELYKADRVADVSLSQWLALTPSDIAAAAINVPIEVIEQIKKEKQYIVS
ncbi:TPA_exp: putative oxalate decarboxylase [Trichophyton benhamiae CBS 112371]|uniref:Probable oxalate decarboxylase ARB_04859 n=1 Tax=Arthroderma benhamiae (strain ATCC MYA-4681 / CBS 112371) TaxID=663331 RepID=OXDD_ARTBC|nr:oxalate decarboxylase, putative [Trichophyton benhamiae CBS 112371]D4AKL6.1 RecName: Full=Probable oxalate decarboxylase ARB_04859; Flags: Precursor [Trichophyton benhamiae CBS 112371]EFE35925.1 oxalate decarboxylase, putative [Trichophyton benhamiae CBS 112371]DAA78741.1 TPA_exp: putative oxalate decarboxylase [Trichophyton benhamiae CBS 112371]